MNPDPIAAVATLPHDLTPLGMFMAADLVVKAVMAGLLLASLVIWIILFGKVAELAEPADIARLSENLDATWQAARDREIEAMMNLDRAFHAILATSSRNSMLPDIMGNLHDRSTRLWFISLRSNEHHVRVCEQHAAVVEGIRKRDPEEAEKAIREHIEAFRENIVRQF